MSLELSESGVLTFVRQDLVSVNDYDFTFKSFSEIVVYFLQNAKLQLNDIRIELLANLQQFDIIEGYNFGGEKIGFVGNFIQNTKLSPLYKDRRIDIYVQNLFISHINNVLYIGDKPITFFDARYLIEYFFTNCDLIPNDPRVALIERIKKMIIVDNFIVDGEQIDRIYSENIKIEPFNL